MVDFHAAAWLGRSLASAREDAEAWDRVELTVVDNSVDDAAHEALRTVLPGDATLLRADQNLGFARACNLAVQHGSAPYVVFVNPDTSWPRGQFAEFVARVEARGECGLLGPRHYADDACELAHAPLRGVRLFDEVHDLWFVRGWDPARPDRLLSARDRLRRRTGAVRVRALSGGCLGTSRALYQRLGGFDERYWMYGEDVELCVRANRRGARVEIHPDVGIVHYMERSARCIPERVNIARDAGRSLFKVTHHGRLARGTESLVHRATARLLPMRHDPFATAKVGLPEHFEPPPHCDAWAIEFARSPLFDNCLTRFLDSAIAVPAPTNLLAELPAATYYARTAACRGDRWQTDRVFRFPRPAPTALPIVEEAC